MRRSKCPSSWRRRNLGMGSRIFYGEISIAAKALLVACERLRPERAIAVLSVDVGLEAV